MPPLTSAPEPWREGHPDRLRRRAEGFPEAIEAIYPRTEVQLCIVHLVRAALNYVPWKLRTPVVADLQSIYRAATAAEA